MTDSRWDGPPIRVVLVDDHSLVREGIASIIDSLECAEVVAEAEDGHQGLRTVREETPDVVLLDISLPGLNGLEVLERLHKDFPDLGIVMVSMHANEEYVARALEKGARGYLLKSASKEELEIAVRAAYRGQTYLSPAVSKPMVERFLSGGKSSENPLDLLTPRQREVLQLVAEGLSSREIADRLHLSVKTVESHRSNLMERLEIHDLAGLVRFAVETGLVGADES